MLTRVRSYVDAQLKTSRRFDAAGMERDHPELFAPFPKRRTSSTSSLASPTSNGDVQPSLEGQLRYWTAEMCSRSPHLFDFVVTVRAHVRLLAAPRLTHTCPPLPAPRTYLARRRRHGALHVMALPAHRPARAALRARLARLPHQLRLRGPPARDGRRDRRRHPREPPHALHVHRLPRDLARPEQQGVPRDQEG